MPTWLRSLGRFVFGSFTCTPLTKISPFWIGSRPLTHLIKVDLPEPEGPHTTTTSPLDTQVVQSFRTWNSAYHLLTRLISIMPAPLAHDGDARLQAADERRGRKRHHEIDGGGEEIHLDEPPVALRHLGGGAEKVGDREHVHERGVLEQDDGLGQEHRDHVAEGLRQHDVGHHLPV